MNIGNISTIIKWISMLIAGSTIGYLTAHGLNLNINETDLSQVICAIIFLILGYIDAKHPNTFTFLKNETNTDDEEVAPVLNDEYTTGDTDDY